ncbi:hypothetical protein D9M72_442500 [compost metagenome]
MQPAQVAPGQPEAAQHAEHAQLHAAGAQPRSQLGGHVAGAESVHRHAHGHAACGGADQRVADRAADRVIGIDVGFQHHLERGLVDGGDQRGEEVLAAVQQPHRIAGGGLAAAPGPAQHVAARRVVAGRGRVVRAGVGMSGVGYP